MEKPIGIPYAQPGMRSSALEELLNTLIEELWDEGYGPEFEANWARTILTELEIHDAYFVTCPECGKKLSDQEFERFDLHGSGRTEDAITKGAGKRYARHYAWAHTDERLGTNLSAIVIADA